MCDKCVEIDRKEAEMITYISNEMYRYSKEKGLDIISVERVMMGLLIAVSGAIDSFVAKKAPEKVPVKSEAPVDISSVKDDDFNKAIFG